MDCTELMLKYREVVRLAWNIGFANAGLWYPEAVEQYHLATCHLFEAMLVMKLGFENDEIHPMTIGEMLSMSLQYETFPRSVLVKAPGEQVFTVVDIARDVRPEEYSLCFVEFFDWDCSGVRDFAFALATIESFAPLPRLVGGQILVSLPTGVRFVVQECN